MMKIKYEIGLIEEMEVFEKLFALLTIFVFVHYADSIR